jgi:hypothetical protein
MDWTTTGASDPTRTPAISAVTVFLREICAISCSVYRCRLIVANFGGGCASAIEGTGRMQTALGELIKSRAEMEVAAKYAPGQQIALRVLAHR